MPENNSSNTTYSLTDHDLLRRFVKDADETAFAEIVRRYQHLVMGVCRRVTGRQSDAEDAFQAVFVALARRPRSIRGETSLSHWLYTVAWRTSRRLVRRRGKRSMESLPEQLPTGQPNPLDQIAAQQHADVLHAELNLLPVRYRQVLVMSYFAQQTSQQIADQLDLTRGTVDGRIRQARNMLRVRLARRGITLGVLLAAGMTLNPSSVAAAVSSSLFDVTVTLGQQTLNGTLPGTMDTSLLEPLIRPEIALVNTKIVAIVGTCLFVVATVAGMAQRDRVAADDLTPQLADSVPPELVQPPIASAASDVAVEVTPPNVVTTTIVAGDTRIPDNASQWVDVSPVTFSELASSGMGARDRWLYTTLPQRIPSLEFPGETSLQEVLETVTQYVTKAHGTNADFRMTAWPNQVALGKAGISDWNDLMVRDVVLQGTTVHDALELILGQTDGLAWDIRNGVLEITTMDAMEQEAAYRHHCVYPVSADPELDELLRQHLRARGIRFDNVIGESHGELSVLRDRLVVTHHRRAQQEVFEFLRAVGALRVTGGKRQSLVESVTARAESVPVVYLPFDESSLVVNLNEDRLSRFISINFSLKINADMEVVARQRLTLQQIEIKDWLLGILKDKTLEDVSNKAGQNILRREIHERCAGVLFPENPTVLQDILFQEFAIQ